MSILGSMVQAVGNGGGSSVASVTKSQTTVTKMVRVDVRAEESGEAATKLTIPSPAWPTLTLYDEAHALRTRFLDLISTRTIYSLSVTHLTHFDQAWKARSISRLREVYWEVLKRWCGEEGARYTYTHRPATVVRYDRRKKVAVVEEVEGSTDNPLASVSRVV